MIIDCDTHIIPKDSFQYIEGDLASKRPNFHFDDKGHYVCCDFPGKPAEVPGTTPHLGFNGSGTNYDGMCDVGVRLRDYERMGIDLQVLVPQLVGWWSYLIEPSLANAMARSHNLAILRIMREYPDKFIGCALVALQDVEGSIRELQWAFDNGFKTAMLDYVYPVREHPCGETLGSRRELWPFFQKAEELNMPLLLHLNMEHGHRCVNLIKFQREGLDIFAPKDDQMNLVSLITSGLLDEFPLLQFIHAESGTAWIKPLVQRLDRIFQRPDVHYEDDFPTHRPRRRLSTKVKQLVPAEVASEKNEKPASYYFRKNFYFTIETEEPELSEAIQFLSADRFLFATDYPHDDPGGSMKFRDVELLNINKAISDEAKEQIRYENARAIFKL